MCRVGSLFLLTSFVPDSIECDTTPNNFPSATFGLAEMSLEAESSKILSTRKTSVPVMTYEDEDIENRLFLMEYNLILINIVLVIFGNRVHIKFDHKEG